MDLICMHIFMGFWKLKWLSQSAFMLILHNAIGLPFPRYVPNVFVACLSALISGLQDEVTALELRFTVHQQENHQTWHLHKQNILSLLFDVHMHEQLIILHSWNGGLFIIMGHFVFSSCACMLQAWETLLSEMLFDANRLQMSQDTVICYYARRTSKAAGLLKL